MARRTNLVAASRSPADAVLLEADCFGDGHPLLAMNGALALGQRYRSPLLVAAMEAGLPAARTLTARSRGKVLRRKLGVSSRAQVVAKALQLGLARLGER
jgi:hypothetical protein